MRELKYKVWDLEDKKIYILEGFDNKGNYEFPVAYFHHKDKPDIARYNSMDKIKLLQYTGLKDMDAKEIYEGDIVISDNGTKYEVYFTDGGFKLSNAKYPNANLQLLDRMISNYIKVIGNIFESKEILEK